MSLLDFVPSALQGLVQDYTLQKTFEVNITPNLQYAREADIRYQDKAQGDTFRFSKPGLLPTTEAGVERNYAMSNTDNTMIANQLTYEQYEGKWKFYSDNQNLNASEDNLSATGTYIEKVKQMGPQIQRITDNHAKQAILSAYLGGHTTPKNATTGTTMYVKNISGFLKKNVSGYPTALSATNKLALSVDGTTVNAQAAHTCDAAVVTGTSTTAFDIDATNASYLQTGDTVRITLYNAAGNRVGIYWRSVSVSSSTLTVAALPNAPLAVYSRVDQVQQDGRIEGVLTLDASTTFALTSSVLAYNRPAIIRPGGVTSIDSLTSSDIATLQTILAMSAVLENAGIPTCSDGFYHCIMDATLKTQLMADSNFLRALKPYPNLLNIPTGSLGVIGNMAFFPTTSPMNTTNSSSVTIRRLFAYGADHLMKLVPSFWKTEADLFKIDGNHLRVPVPEVQASIIYRNPMDKLGLIHDFSWDMTHDFVAATDALADFGDYPDAYYKRGIIAEVGS